MDGRGQMIKYLLITLSVLVLTVSNVYAQPVHLVNNANNPTLPTGGEAALYYDSSTGVLHQWFRTFSAGGMFYTSANNALVDNWTTPVPLNLSGLFPVVFVYNNTFYMLLNESFTGRTFIYSSTDKLNWAIANGGNPVLTPSSDPNSYYHFIYNTSIAIKGTTAYILFESSDAAATYQRLSLATADLSTLASNSLNFNPTIPTSPTIPVGNCPDLHYVPERDALLAVFAAPYLPLFAGGEIVLKFGMAPLGGDISLPSGWMVPGVSLGPPAERYADPVFIDVGESIILGYSYHQNTWGQGYMPFASDAALYDALVAQYLVGWPTQSSGALQGLRDDPQAAFTAGYAMQGMANIFSARNQFTAPVTINNINFPSEATLLLTAPTTRYVMFNMELGGWGNMTMYGDRVDGVAGFSGAASKFTVSMPLHPAAGVYTSKVCYTVTVCDYAGAGSPEGVIPAGVGSTYRNVTNGDFHRKVSGEGPSGWLTP